MTDPEAPPEAVEDDDTPTAPASPQAIAGVQCIVRPLADGDEVVDCFEDLTAADCAFLLSQNKKAVGQYLEQLTVAKIATILRSRLGLFVISECARPNWGPTGAGGTMKGQEMVLRARQLLLPRELPLIVDYETPAADTTVENATAWLNNVSGEIVSDLRPAELYVGYRPILSGVQLYELPKFTRYYASSPFSPTLPCGYVLQQHAWNVRLGSLLVDLDRVRADQHAPPRLPLALFAA